MLPHEPSCMLSHGITRSTSVLDLSHLVVHSPSYKDQRNLTNPSPGEATKTARALVNARYFLLLGGLCSASGQQHCE